jgi:hypothetical protein
MSKYRKKPVVIEAVQFTGDVGAADIMPLDLACEHVPGLGDCLYISTLEGTMRVDPGDWIIRGVKNELYPCKPDIFAQTYEKVE